MPRSCALLSGLATGARVLLLWQHKRLMRNVSEDDCTRCVAGYCLLPTNYSDPQSDQPSVCVSAPLWTITFEKMIIKNADSSWPYRDKIRRLHKVLSVKVRFVVDVTSNWSFVTQVACGKEVGATFSGGFLGKCKRRRLKSAQSSLRSLRSVTQMVSN